MYISHSDHPENPPFLADWESSGPLRDKVLIDRVLHAHIRQQGRDVAGHDLAYRYRCRRNLRGYLSPACQGSR